MWRRISHHGGFSIEEHRLWGAWVLVVAAHGLSSCGFQALGAQVQAVVVPGLSGSCDMRDLPGLGIGLSLLHWRSDSLPLSPVASAAFFMQETFTGTPILLTAPLGLEGSCTLAGVLCPNLPLP